MTLSFEYKQIFVSIQHENTQEESGSNCGYHGNIRCRNVLVFNSGTGSQNTSIKVKLSDPGMVALYNKLPLDHVINEDRYAGFRFCIELI